MPSQYDALMAALDERNKRYAMDFDALQQAQIQQDAYNTRRSRGIIPMIGETIFDNIRKKQTAPAYQETLSKALDSASGVDEIARQLEAMQALAAEQADREKYLFEQQNKAFAPQKPEADPTVVRSLRAAGIDPASPEGQAIIKQNLTKGNTSYNITPPAGYTFADPNNPAAGFKLIPGSPQERDIQSEEDKAAKSDATQSYRASSVLEEIDHALSLVSGKTTGIPGQLTAEIGGTDARSLAGQLKTIQANLGFDRLTQMREESKTGGALGQVSNIELQLLTSSVANLDQAADDDELRRRLMKVKQHYKNFTDALSGKMPYQVERLGGKEYAFINGEWVEL